MTYSVNHDGYYTLTPNERYVTEWSCDDEHTLTPDNGEKRCPFGKHLKSLPIVSLLVISLQLASLEVNSKERFALFIQSIVQLVFLHRHTCIKV